MAEIPKYTTAFRPLPQNTSLSGLPIPGTFTPKPPPRQSLDAVLRSLSYGLSQDIVGAGKNVANALMAPGNALRGQYSQTEIEPSGYVRPFSSGLMDAASNMAGVVTTGAMPFPRPVNSLGMGASVHSNADLLAKSLIERNIPVSKPAHSINRYGEYSSYIDTPLGQIRVSDHSKNANFDTSVLNIMDIGQGMNVASEADRIASLFAQSRQAAATEAAKKAQMIAPFSSRYKAATTDAERDSILRSAIDSGAFGAQKWSGMSRTDRSYLRKILLR